MQARPEDIEDGSVYIAVPHNNDLDLGRSLALSFADGHLPDSFEVIASFLRQRGAHGRFKDLLERKGCLQVRYEYGTSAVERALRK